MSGVSLSEQMGAMALIDELRHSQTEIQKHLDLPKHRKAVAERIREFYKAQGVEVEDALVEQGVRNYFATRLTYDAPTLRWWERRLTRLYIDRRQWLKGTLIWAPIILWSLYAWSQVITSHVEQRRYTQADLISMRSQLDSRSQQLYTQRERLGRLHEQATSDRVPAADRMLEKARELLEKAQKLTLISLPEKAVPEDQRSFADSNKVFAARNSLKDVTNAMDALQVQLDDVLRVLLGNQKLNALVGRTSYSPISKAVPEVLTEAAKARSALDQADTVGVATALAAVDRLERLIDQNSLSPTYLAALESARGAVGKMGLNPADAAQFEPLFTSVDRAINAQDASAATRSLKDIDQLLTFAKTPLKLNVVSRAGEKSMIERNYDPTGGKSWYLLTEATDAAGNVVQVPITSRETGEKRYAKVFGVRVSEATYQEVKKDKLADGHVDNRSMGSKDANALGLKFVKGRTTGNPDYILEW